MAGGTLHRTIVLTGANGNLGQKIARHLLAGTTTISGKRTEWHVKMLDDYDGFCQGIQKDPSPPQATGTIEFVRAKLNRWGSWNESFQGADSAVHLAAHNPYPEATWEDARLSMEMTSNAIAAAQQHSVRRFVHASSNHVYGRYWREGATLSESGCSINLNTPPNPGTSFRTPSFDCDATPYAAAKLAGECALKSACVSTPGLSGISMRIGWCQPGENLPSTMTATGTPSVDDDDSNEASLYSNVALGFDDERKILPWFENMWLSNRDMLQCVERCIEYDFDSYLPIFAMSRNTNMRWDISNPIGFEPVDDVAVEKAGGMAH